MRHHARHRPVCRRSRWLALAVGLWFLVVAPGGAEEDLRAGRLRPGLFLYAVPEMRDPNFAESVVVLLDHSLDGSVGLIVNQPLPVTVHEALPELEGGERLSAPLYYGGPVSRGAILALLRAKRRPGRADKVMEEVYATRSLETLVEALRRKDPDRNVRIYAGYSGWGAGQLEDELRREDWVLRPGTAEAVFAEEPDRIWPDVFELREQLEVRLGRLPWWPGSSRRTVGVP
jgi:putative transcriptional regulator